MLLVLPLRLWGQEPVEENRQEAAGAEESGPTIPEPDSLFKAMVDRPGWSHFSYQGGRLEYRPRERRYFLWNEARIQRGALSIAADSIGLDQGLGFLEAWGEPVLRDREEEVFGEQMRYDLRGDKGIIYNGRLSHGPWLMRGNRISKVGSDHLYLWKGHFTTCELPDPHYHFGAKRIKVILDDLLVASPLVLYVRDVPVFALPFWIFPLKRGRRSGILRPSIGLESFIRPAGTERSIRNLGYYWAINDHLDALFAADLFTKTRTVFRFQGRYRWRYQFDGSLTASLVDNRFVGGTDFNLFWRHDQPVGQKGQLRGDIQFASSKDVFRRNSFDVEEILDRSLQSRAFYNRRTDWGSYRAALDVDFFLDRDRTTFRAPELQASLNSRPLFGGRRTGGGRLWYENLSYSVSGSFENRVVDEEVEQGDLRASFTRNSQTSRTFLSLRGPQTLFGSLNLTPAMNLQETLFRSDLEFSGDSTLVDRRVTGGTVVDLTQVTASLSANLRLFGLFNTPSVFGLRRWRHTLAPTVAWSYSPETGDPEELQAVGFPGGAGRAVNRLNFGLENTVEAKKDPEAQPVRLFTFRQSLGLDLEQESEPGRIGLSDLASRLESSPGGRFSLSLNAVHSLVDRGTPARIVDGVVEDPGTADRFDPFLRSLTSALSLRGPRLEREAPPLPPVGAPSFGPDQYEEDQGIVPSLVGPWNFNMTYTLNRTREGLDRHFLRGSLAFNPTPRWRLNYHASYDISDGEFRSQTIGLQRDLHHWRANLSIVILPENRFAFNFSLFLLEEPSIRLPLTRRVD